jgi:hypothetical protein
MHNTILDLQHLVNTQTKPTLIHLTETKHSQINSIWREAVEEYKQIHAPPKLDLATNRRSAGTILAARRDTYKDVTAIPTPSHLRDYISAATRTPHDGSPIIAISAYIGIVSQETLYIEILK